MPARVNDGLVDNSGQDPDLEEEDELEPVEELLARWSNSTDRLRDVAYRARTLRRDLNHALAQQDCRAVGEIITWFSELSQGADRASFQSLCLQTSALHHRGTGVLNPDYGPYPDPSLFVRHIPDIEAESGKRRRQWQARHIPALEDHMRQAIDHFIKAWMALIEGSLICDFELIDDEFPKLAELDVEVQRAFDLWSEQMAHFSM